MVRRSVFYIILISVGPMLVADLSWGQQVTGAQPSLPPNNQAGASSVHIESSPIQIMGQPPDPDFKDEFALPVGASPELVARRNLIDFTNGKINQIEQKLEEIMMRQSFDGSAEEIEQLKAMQSAYEAELKALKSAQENFGSQKMEDDDKVYNKLPDDGKIMNQDLKEFD